MRAKLPLPMNFLQVRPGTAGQVELGAAGRPGRLPIEPCVLTELLCFDRELWLLGALGRSHDDGLVRDDAPLPPLQSRRRTLCTTWQGAWTEGCGRETLLMSSGSKTSCLRR